MRNELIHTKLRYFPNRANFSHYNQTLINSTFTSNSKTHNFGFKLHDLWAKSLEYDVEMMHTDHKWIHIDSIRSDKSHKYQRLMASDHTIAPLCNYNLYK